MNHGLCTGGGEYAWGAPGVFKHGGAASLCPVEANTPGIPSGIQTLGTRLAHFRGGEYAWEAPVVLKLGQAT